jgi:hypothetical protein
MTTYTIYVHTHDDGSLTIHAPIGANLVITPISPREFDVTAREAD